MKQPPKVSSLASPSRGTIQHVIFGFFEELMTPGPAEGTWKFLGIRDVEKPEGRECGYNGRVEYKFTAPITVKRGTNTVTLQASKRKPLIAVGTLQMKCGREL